MCPDNGGPSPAPNLPQRTCHRTCVIAPVVCGAGAPSSLAFPPPGERACGTPGARCTPGPDADAVVRKGMRQDFRSHRDQPGVPHAVGGDGSLRDNPGDRTCSFITTPETARSPLESPAGLMAQGDVPGSRDLDRSPLKTVVRRVVQEILPSLGRPARLSQWYPDHSRAVLPAGSRHSCTARRRISGVHRIPPRNRDDRDRPSRWGRTERIIFLLPDPSRTN